MNPTFLSGGGEMGARIRAFDWTRARRWGLPSSARMA
jgi:hypothetical protein